MATVAVVAVAAVSGWRALDVPTLLAGDAAVDTADAVEEDEGTGGADDADGTAAAAEDPQDDADDTAASGTDTSDAGPSWADDTTIAVDYTIHEEGDAGCCPTGGTQTVRDQWDGESLEPLDEIPPIEGVRRR